MSLKLCICGSLLKEVATDNLIYICDACKKQYEPNPEDTLLFEEIKSATVTNYHQLINNAVNDRLNPKRRADCSRCKKEVWVNYITLGTSMTIVYTCLDCANQWIP